MGDVRIKGVMWDDKEEFRKPVVRTLGRFGIKVIDSDNAEKVIGVVKRDVEEIDFAIIDLVDERYGYDTCGLDTIRAIRHQSRCFIMALTGHGDEIVGASSLENAATDAGADIVVDKSVRDLREEGGLARAVYKGIVTKTVDNIHQKQPALPTQAIATGVISGLRCGKFVDASEWSRDAEDPNSQNYKAFLIERPDLLKKGLGQFVAYADGRQIAIGPDRDRVYQQARKKIRTGVVMVQMITRADDEPMLRLRKPLPTKARINMSIDKVKSEREPRNGK